MASDEKPNLTHIIGSAAGGIGGFNIGLSAAPGVASVVAAAFPPAAPLTWPLTFLAVSLGAGAAGARIGYKRRSAGFLSLLGIGIDLPDAPTSFKS